MNRRLRKLNRSRERFHRLYNTNKYGARYFMDKNTTDRSRSDYISPTSSGSGGGTDVGGGADVGGGDQESFLYGDLLPPLSRQRTDSSLQKLNPDIAKYSTVFFSPALALTKEHWEQRYDSITQLSINLDNIPHGKDKYTEFSNLIDNYHNLISLKITGLDRVRNDYEYISKIGQKNVLPNLEI